MQLFHIVSRDSVDAVLRKGLRYGSQGELSKDSLVSKVNDYLDIMRPRELQSNGVSRNKCIYLYFAANGDVHDIADGSNRRIRYWATAQSSAVIAAAIDPAHAYVSDLDAYDAVAEAFDTAAPASIRRQRATTYWGRMISLQDLVDHYRQEDEDFVLSLRKRRLPLRFARIEIMLTCDVPPGQLTRLA